MRKYVAAALIGLALIGTQAAAADSLAINADDRLGSNGGSDSLLAGTPLYVYIYGAAFAGVVGWMVSDHGGAPASP
jgi:hypothetical protein